MEPKDEKLKELLQKWQAPAAPKTLARRVFPDAPRLRWWRWLWTGSIRVPVPVGLAALAIAVVLYWPGRTEPQAGAPEKPVSLADFRPVEQLEPRIIRSVANEGN